MNEMQSSPPSTRLSTWLRPNRMVAGFLGVMLSVSLAQSAEQPALGSSDFKPNREQPYGWRGDGSGCFPGATNPPSRWNLATGQGVRWSQSIRTGWVVWRVGGFPYVRLGDAFTADAPGRGDLVLSGSFSSPVIVGPRVYTLSEPNWVLCFDKMTGQELWRRAYDLDLLGDQAAGRRVEDLPMSLYLAERAGFTTPTPVTDGESLWCVFAFGLVVRLDLEGEVQWAREFIAASEKSNGGALDSRTECRPGFAQSPLLCNDPTGKPGAILVTCGVESDAYVGWEAATGKRLWQVAFPGFGHGTPKVGNGSPVRYRRDGKDFIVTADGWIIDPATGTVVQRLVEGKPQHGDDRSPVVTGDLLVLHGGQLAFDIGEDGRCTPRWNIEGKNRDRSVSSPLVTGGRVVGTQQVVDAATGASVFALPATTYSISPVQAGTLLYLFDNRNAMVISATADAWKPDTFPHGFAARPGKHGWGRFSTPVFEGSRMYVRDQSGLHCLDSQVAQDPIPTVTLTKLIETLSAGTDTMARASAAQQLPGRIAQANRRPRFADEQRVIDELANLAESTDAEVRTAAFEALTEIVCNRFGQPRPSVVERILALAKHAQASVRAGALGVLARADGDQVVAALIRGLADNEHAVVIRALRALRGRKDLALPDPLPAGVIDHARQFLLTDGRRGHFIAIGEAVAVLGPAAAPMLLDVIKDSATPWHVRKAAFVALDRMWHKVAETAGPVIGAAIAAYHERAGANAEYFQGVAKACQHEGAAKLVDPR